VPRSDRRRRRSLVRPVALGMLVVLTVLAAGWYVLGRGRSGTEAPALDFSSVEARFVAAARELPATTAVVQEFHDLGQFNYSLDLKTRIIQNSMAEFVTIVNERNGEESKLARRAITNGENMLRAIVRFREAITETNDLVDAQTALADIATQVDDLEAKVKAWKST
jgi:hypothetical protein